MASAGLIIGLGIFGLVFMIGIIVLCVWLYKKYGTNGQNNATSADPMAAATSTTAAPTATATVVPIPTPLPTDTGVPTTTPAPAPAPAAIAATVAAVTNAPDPNAPYLASDMNYVKTSGGLSQVDVSDAGDVWGTINGAVYRRVSGSDSWTNMNPPVKMSQVSVGASGVFALDTQGYVYQYNLNVNTWSKLSGQLKNITSGSGVYGIGPDGNVYVYGSSSGWTKSDGTLAQISNGDDGSLWGVTTSGAVYQKVNGVYVLMPGNLDAISSGKSGVFGVKNGAIYVWNQAVANWRSAASPSSVPVQCGASGNQFWCTDTSSGIYVSNAGGAN